MIYVSPKSEFNNLQSVKILQCCKKSYGHIFKGDGQKFHEIFKIFVAVHQKP